MTRILVVIDANINNLTPGEAGESLEKLIADGFPLPAEFEVTKLSVKEWAPFTHAEMLHELNKLRMVMRLSNSFLSYSFTSQMVSDLDNDGWDKIAKKHGYKKISPTTRQQVINAMAQAEVREV